VHRRLATNYWANGPVLCMAARNSLVLAGGSDALAAS